MIWFMVVMSKNTVPSKSLLVTSIFHSLWSLKGQKNIVDAITLEKNFSYKQVIIKYSMLSNDRLNMHIF